MAISLAQLHSLDLFRAFVAVGRRGNVTIAADDLCLTQSAVSRQIHTLEAQLGIRLFVRRHRGVELTAAGENLFRTADNAIRLMQEAVAEMGFGLDGGRAVAVSSTTSVVGLWLLPRLGQLQEQHPCIDVRLAANNTVQNLLAEDVDLAIRYTRDVTAPPGSVRLFDETLAPVAHPKFEERLARGEYCPLLEFENSRPWLQWRRWLGDSHWGKARWQVLRFNQYDQVIHAALAGQGIALGRIELLQRCLDSGDLTVVSLRCRPIQSPYAYWLIQTNEDPREEVVKVAEWVRLEAQWVRQWMPKSQTPIQRGALQRRDQL